MANNSSSPYDICGLPPIFWAVYYWAYTASYYGMASIFLVFGFIGQLVCLLAFFKESKKESAYAYQVFVGVSQACEVVFYTFYVLTLKWSSGVERDSVAWFRNHYFLVWYTAHLATPLSNMCITTSLLLSLCMSIERFWALYTPHVYKNWNHRRNRIISVASSVFLGVTTTIFAFFRYNVFVSDDPTQGYYKVVLDVQFASTALSNTLSHIRNFLRIGGLILLIICNSINLRLFRSRVMRVGNNEIGTNAAATNAAKNARKIETERTLFILVIVESTLTALSMSALTAYFFAIFTSPVFTKCEGLLMIALVDATLNIANMGKFYIVLLVDKRFRKMVSRALKCTKANSTSVTRLRSEANANGLSTNGGQMETHTIRTIAVLEVREKKV